MNRDSNIGPGSGMDVASQDAAQAKAIPSVPVAAFPGKSGAPPFVSIVIPYFNEIHKLKRAVESLAAQTWKPREVVLVDDCGMEAMDPGIIETLHGSGIATQLLRNECNRGPGGSRQNGMDHLDPATEFLLFLDSDDWLSPRFIEASVGVHRRHKGIIATYGNSLNLAEGYNRVHDTQNPVESLLDGLLDGRRWGTGALLWDFRQIRGVRWSGRRIHEDYHFELSAAIVNHRVRYVPDATLHIDQNWELDRLLARNRFNPDIDSVESFRELYNRMIIDYPYASVFGRQGRYLRMNAYKWLTYNGNDRKAYGEVLYSLLRAGRLPAFMMMLRQLPRILLGDPSQPRRATQG